MKDNRGIWLLVGMVLVGIAAFGIGAAAEEHQRKRDGKPAAPFQMQEEFLFLPGMVWIWYGGIAYVKFELSIWLAVLAGLVLVLSLFAGGWLWYQLFYMAAKWCLIRFKH